MEINVTWPDTSNQWYMMSNFYGLLKVDKLKKIKEVILQQKEYIELFEPNDLTPRPTVGEPDCPTKPLSEHINIILSLFLIHIRSYVKDNLDFLRKCSFENNDSTVLITFNVSSLYTSTLNKYGIEAVNLWIEKYPQTLHPKFLREAVLEGMKPILENNNCNI